MCKIEMDPTASAGAGSVEVGGGPAIKYPSWAAWSALIGPPDDRLLARRTFRCQSLMVWWTARNMDGRSP